MYSYQSYPSYYAYPYSDYNAYSGYPYSGYSFSDYPYSDYPYSVYQSYPSYNKSNFLSQQPKFHDKPEPPVQNVKHNKSYWYPLGILRLSVIFATLGGVIASWLIVIDPIAFVSLDTGTQSTRAADIVIFSIFFPLFMLIFAMSISNFVNLPGVDSKYYLFAVSLAL